MSPPLYKVVCGVVLLLLFAGPPRCRLEDSLRRLPREEFRLCVPGGGEPLPPGSTIAVLSDLLESPPDSVPELPKGCPAILSGQNEAAALFARREGLLPVDCGLSIRDSLTLSSVTETSAVISLQRPVARLDGSLVEPVEFPLTLTRRWTPYHLLCCGGALLLAGGAPALERADIF